MYEGRLVFVHATFILFFGGLHGMRNDALIRSA